MYVFLISSKKNIIKKGARREAKKVLKTHTHPPKKQQSKANLTSKTKDLSKEKSESEGACEAKKKEQNRKGK